MNNRILDKKSNHNSVYPAMIMTVLAIIGILAIYHETVWSMVTTWHRSETYAHGFLILPFVVYMIWTKRHSLITINQKPSSLALIALCVLGLFWLIAELASVLILKQYFVVAMLPVVVGAVLGFRMMYALAFPLAYLFFAVPFGDILIPPLINFTADFTVNALQLSGIPVFREGTFFSLPSGNWSVIEACSGLRYLIASVTLGTLYAYLTYRSLTRRAIFILFSIIVPIVANGVRAYLIVMTGHLSDMELAVGVDHLIYGWVFFGLVMLTLFWIGSIWREDRQNEINAEKMNNSSAGNSAFAVSIKQSALFMCGVLMVASIWPVYAAYLEKDVDDEPPEFNFSLSDRNWRADGDPASNWEPIYIGLPQQFTEHFVNHENQKVSLFITYYHNQKQGNELINSGNVLVPEVDSKWYKISDSKLAIKIGESRFDVRQAELNSFSKNLLVWRWYVLDGVATTSPYIAKALLAKNQLLSGDDFGAEIIVAAPYDIKIDEGSQILHQFLKDMLATISDNLEKINQ